MRKIVFINENGGFGAGVERYVYNTATLLRKNGYEICGVFERKTDNAEEYLKAFDSHYFFSDTTPDKLVSDLKNNGYEVALVHKVSDHILLKKMIESNIRIITFIYDHDYYCPRKNKRLPVINENCTRSFDKLVCSVCCFSCSGKKDQTLDIIRKSRQYIVMSEFMGENLRKNGFKSKRIVKLYPWIEIPENNDIETPENSITEILFSGRLIKEKGIDLLIKAISLVKSPFTLRIVGRGDELKKIEKLVASLGIREKVIFEGWQRDISAFYKKADIVVLPSRWQEPFGLGGIEAFAYGKPVVAFNVGGLGEWVVNERNGYLAVPGDIKEMSAKIEDLIINKEKRKHLGRNARKFIEENFIKEIFVHNFNKIFDIVYVRDIRSRGIVKDSIAG